MKECLNCQNDFNAKRGSAKFCSVNCRVAYNRKQPQKNKITKPQMSALYNSLMEAIANMGHINSQQKQYIPVTDKSIPMVINSNSVIRSFEYYQKARIECETEEEWLILKTQIQNDIYLSSRQKSLLIN